MSATKINIDSIDMPHSPVVRHEIVGEVAEDYANAYQNNVEMPPIDVFTTDGKTYILADGAHRLTALGVMLKKTTVMANVHKGGYEEALKFALLANEKHGLRRSQADRRHCIVTAIKQWPKNSDNSIAQLCAVSNHTVKSVRDQLEQSGKVSREAVRVDKAGAKRPAGKPKVSATELLGNCQDPSASKSTSDTKPVKIQEKDKVGKILTAHALTYWNRAPEITELMGHISILNQALRKAQKNEDLMFGEVNISAAIADLGKVWTNLGTAMPYALCTQCQGKSSPDCRMCKGRGVISRFRWDTLVPAEIRRLAAAK